MTAPDHEQAERIRRAQDVLNTTMLRTPEGEFYERESKALAQDVLALAAQLAEQEREIEELRQALEWIAANVREPRMQLEAESALESLRSDSEESDA